MKILVLAQYYPPDLGGSTTRASNVARGLAENGVDVIVVTAFPHYPHGKIPEEYRWKPFTREYCDGVDVIRTFMVPLGSKGVLFRMLTFVTFIFSSLIGLLLVDGVEAVWAANKDIFVLLPGLIYKTRFKCPLIFNVDDLSLKTASNLKVMKEGGFFYRLAEFFTRFFYRFVDAVTPISPGYFDSISRFGVAPEDIYLVRSGVNLDIFKEKSLSGSVFRVAYSGSFSIAYDFEQVVRAAELLSGCEIEFILQGKGETVDDIKQLIRERCLSNVRVLDCILSREEVADFLGAADVLLLPLKDFGVPYLGISSKLYEYQALGKPIICCSHGSSADLVRDTGSGLIVAPGDHEGLAEAVRFLHDNPLEAERMGRSGREYVERHVGVERIGVEMKQVLEQVIAEVVA